MLYNLFNDYFNCRPLAVLRGKLLKKFLSVFLIFLVCVACLCGCRADNGFEDGFSSSSFFGTFLQVALFCGSDTGANRQAVNQAKGEMLAELEKIQNALDADKNDSDVARFNNAVEGERVEVSKVTAECFALAKTVYDATNGAYNPAVYNLVDLWGFSSRVLSKKNQVVFDYDRATPSVPSKEYITAFKELANFEDIVVTETFDGKYYLTKPKNTQTVRGVKYTVKIDFGGICKGYASDKMEQIAKAYGIDCGYFSVGQSSIKFLNSVDGKGFNVDLENPLDTYSVLLTKQKVKNQSISVSGDYQRLFEENSKKYCHIIDASTGYPVDAGVNAVFAVCDDSAVCDAVTTALMTLPKEEIARLSQSEAFKKLGVTSVVAVSASQEEIAVYTNARDIIMQDNDAKRYGFTLTEDGGVDFKAVSDYRWAWAVVVLVVIAIFVVGALAKKQKKANDVQNQSTDIKQINTAFFVKGDLLIYLTLFVVIISTFVVAQIGFKKQDLQTVEVFCQNSLLFVFDCTAFKIDKISADWQDRLVIAVDKDKITVSIFLNDEKTEYNVVEFLKNQAKMVKSTCVGKDCVKTASTVSRANQFVLCMPHELMIVGVGEGNKGVR